MIRTGSRLLLPGLVLALSLARGGELPELNSDNVDALAFRWLREYVDFIITDSERQSFLQLETSEQRLMFIDQFWRRRDPTPGTPENEAREEHLRRVSYANKHFSAGKPGWKTDRGRVYILLGPPQQRQRNAMGRAAGERASEVWSYNGIQSRSLPASFDLSFVDFNDTGDYQIVTDLNLAAPIRTYAGYVGNPLDVLSRALNSERLTSPEDFRAQRDTFDFDRLEQAQFELMRNLQAVQEGAHAADLPKSEVETQIQFHNFPVHLAEAYYRAGGGNTRVQVNFSVDFSSMSSKLYQRQRYFHIEVLGRILRGDAGTLPVDEVRRDLAFQVPESQLAEAVKSPLVSRLEYVLAPGPYTLELLVRDAVSQRVSITRREFVAPDLGGEGLVMSTPLLCQTIGSASDPDAVGFVEGSLRVFPRVPAVFRPDETMHVYLQLNRVERDTQGAHRLQIDYRIWSPGGGIVLRAPTQHSEGSVLGPIALSSGLPLRQLARGSYELEAIVLDTRTGQRVTRRAPFEVQHAAAR